MKAFCNENLISRSDKDITFVHAKPNTGVMDLVKLYFREDVDSILFFHDNLKLNISSIIYKLLNGKAKIYYWDILLKKPNNIKGASKALLKKIAYSFAHRILCVHKDTSEYENNYKINKNKIKYIPFKANNFEIIENYPPSDEGYILACGVSHRDYNTFFAAINNINVKVKIALPNQQNINLHQAKIDKLETPTNVETITHDFNKDTWNELLSKAKFIVIPIEINCIQPAGISVYLESMLLKKPVIISECPSTRGLIDNGEALIVEPNNPEALRQAIVNLLNNSELQQQLSKKGFEYAKKLEGVDRLVADLKKELIDNK